MRLRSFLLKHKYPLLLACAIVLAAGMVLAKHLVQNATTVVISNNAFTPEALVVTQGDTVKWVNNGPGASWPASNEHPTHTYYPSRTKGCIGSLLDACRGLNQNESYSFTFTEIGSWGVHDHLSPGAVMSITVEPRQSFTQRVSGMFAKMGKQEKQAAAVISTAVFLSQNYAEQLAYTKTLAATNPSAAWHLVKDAANTQPTFTGTHEFAHIIGNAAYTKMGMDGMGICDETFGFGCYHGVTEQMLQDAGKQSTQAIQNACLTQFPPAESFKWASCIHGIGHGLLSYEKLQVAPALTDCDVLEPQNRHYCYDGVLMEYQNAVPADPQKDPWALCLSFAEAYHMACVRNLVPPYFTVAGKPDAGVCHRAPSQQFRDICFQRFGFMAASASNGQFQGIKQQCDTIQESVGHATCITGAATEVIFQEYAQWRQVSLKLCDSLNADARAACLASNESTMINYQRKQ